MKRSEWVGSESIQRAFKLPRIITLNVFKKSIFTPILLYSKAPKHIIYYTYLLFINRCFAFVCPGLYLTWL